MLNSNVNVGWGMIERRSSKARDLSVAHTG